nr:iron-sulfur cluster biosynthesis family protein [Texcoconibacillus texcoconensis]
MISPVLKECVDVQVTLTDEGRNIVKRAMSEQLGMLKIVYDTDGCGCAVSGVPKLQLVSNKTETDIDIKSEDGDIPILIERRFQVFFDPKMTLSASVKPGRLQLKSDQQIFHSRLAITY